MPGKSHGYLISLLTLITVVLAGGSVYANLGADECSNPDPAWIWCDDFEIDRSKSYFEQEINPPARGFSRAEGVGINGSWGTKQEWTKGQVSGGGFKIGFGNTESKYEKPVDGGGKDYREIYWRMYVKTQEGWVGGGAAKLSRATILTPGWAQPMIAHIWSMGGNTPNDVYLGIDPASGTDPAGNLRANKYNDFNNLRWLGAVRGNIPLFSTENSGKWFCVEAQVKLNDPGENNGIFRLWINDELQAEKTRLNWIGSYDKYGINTLFVENYWNTGSPVNQERYFDNVVISTERIGCPY
jgi:hypothetical protein